MIKSFINRFRPAKTVTEKATPPKSSQEKVASPQQAKPQPKKQPQQANPKKSASTKPNKHNPQRHSQQNTHQKQNHKKPQNKPSWDISQFSIPAEPGKTRFHDLDLPIDVMHAIHDLGFKYCSPIQAQTLPHTLQGYDVIGKAQTGTGKTAAFLITIIDEILSTPIDEERHLKDPRALILAPTRELALQIAEDAKLLCKYCGIGIVALIGGEKYEKQHRQLTEKVVDIVVATPGRLIDFMTRDQIYINQVEFLVLDEADRMLDMGFIPQLKRIVRATPKKEDRQTLLFSATFDQDIINLSRQWTFEPVHIEIEPDSIATKQVEQKVYLVSKDEKFKVLMNILKDDDTKLSLIFANRKDHTQQLFDKLKRAKINVGILTGDINQQRRSKTLENFKAGRLDVLVATDVVGRGIHIDGVSHVINYNLPEDPEDYVHRIGRTGRADATGISISLACEYESFQIPAIEELLGKKMNCELPPDELMK